MILALVVIAFLPGAILGATLGPAAGVAMAFGAVGVLMVALSSGPRTALLCAVPYGLAATLVVEAADRPWLAFAVMGLAAGLAAWTARFGMAGAFSLMPIMLGFLLGEPPVMQDGRSIAWIGVLVAVGAAWTAGVSAVVRKRTHLPEPQRHTPARSLFYAVVLGLVVGAAAALIAAYQWGHGGAWFVMTLIIVVQPYLQDSWHRAVQRGIGTVIGVVAAVLLGAIIPWPWLGYAAAVVLIFLALRVRLQPKRPYWQFVMFLTPSIILFEGESGSVVDLAGSRLIATFGAIAIGALLVAVLTPFLKPLSQRAGLDRY